MKRIAKLGTIIGVLCLLGGVIAGVAAYAANASTSNAVPICAESIV